MSPPPGAGSGLESDSRRPGAAVGSSPFISSVQPVEYGLAVANSLAPVSWLPAAAAPNGQEQAFALAQQEADIGDRLYQQAKFEAACEHYRQAVRLRDSEPSYHYKLACATWRGGSWTEARDAFLAALRLDPNNAWSHDGLGQWYLEDGAIDRALAHSTRALELSPGDPDLIVSQAFVLHTLGRVQEAWQLIEPLIARQHESGRLALLFSRLARPLKQDGRALAFTEKLLTGGAIAAPERPALHFAA